MMFCRKWDEHQARHQRRTDNETGHAAPGGDLPLAPRGDRVHHSRQRSKHRAASREDARSGLRPRCRRDRLLALMDRIG